MDTVSASDNTLTGAYLNNCLRSGGNCQGHSLVTITSATANLFYGNQDGLVVDAGGGILINHVQAGDTLNGGNTLNGAILTSTDADSATVTGNVTVTQSEFNLNPNGNGLKITTDGNITLTDITASDNQTGADLDTTDGTGTITVNATDPALPSNFTDNDGTGLHAESGNTIDLSNVDASGNGSNGAYLDAAGNITVTDSTFSDNVHLKCSY